ncbi:hypothetical protein C4J86_0897 [Pseudomonas sp. R2-7-07]|nr:hypothetical protein C4J86_0897 [Pseudomonas sp. R2-7-07]
MRWARNAGKPSGALPIPGHHQDVKAMTPIARREIIWQMRAVAPANSAPMR